MNYLSPTRSHLSCQFLYDYPDSKIIFRLFDLFHYPLLIIPY